MRARRRAGAFRVAAVAALAPTIAVSFACGRTPPVGVDEATGIRLVELPAGRFMMGSPATEARRSDDETLHEVTLTRSFFVGQYEVTQAEWRELLGTNPANHAGCDACPIERINFYDVGRFIAALNARSRRFRYRLLTEAEWEYACRAGTSTPFSTGEHLTADQANYNGEYPYDGPHGPNRGATTPVGGFAPNAWGLYDMHGNVWEWNSDFYGPLAGAPATDPTGAPPAEKHVIRGGSFYFDGNSARCAARYTHSPIDLGFSLGMRVAADPK